MNLEDQIKRFESFTFIGKNGQNERREMFKYLQTLVGTTLPNGVKIKELAPKHGGVQLKVGNQKLWEMATMSSTWHYAIKELKKK